MEEGGGPTRMVSWVGSKAQGGLGGSPDGLSTAVGGGGHLFSL